MVTMNEFATAYGITLTHEAVGKVVIDGKTPFKYNVTVKMGKKEFTTEFTMGSGHVGKKSALRIGEIIPLKFHEMKSELAKVRYGEYSVIGPRLTPIPPDLVTVLDCLRSDCSCFESSGIWEDFASELGLNVDSIKDKKVFKACRDIHAKLKRMFGDAMFASFLAVEPE